mmetsp:Transcript_10953/g.14637  ORF Transcript_10953/g.14637 Transcript_10953/m.14637 type:complete len:562 (+) Transcript_10953:36-1721(+)
MFGSNKLTDSSAPKLSFTEHDFMLSFQPPPPFQQQHSSLFGQPSAYGQPATYGYGAQQQQQQQPTPLFSTPSPFPQSSLPIFVNPSPLSQTSHPLLEAEYQSPPKKQQHLLSFLDSTGKSPTSQYHPFLGKCKFGYEEDEEVLSSEFTTYDASFVDEEEDEDVEMMGVEEESQNSTTFDFLPEDILCQIFRYLDTKSFCSASSVCVAWRKAAGSPWLWWMRCNVVWDHILYMSQKNAVLCHQLFMEILLEKKYQTRIKFLLETLNELSERTKKRCLYKHQSHYNTDCYLMMANVMLSQLYDSNTIIKKIKQAPGSMTVNFDILDLSLRRYIHQIDNMFPVRSSECGESSSSSGVKSCLSLNSSLQTCPSSIIKDPSARKFWETHVGTKLPFINFNHFYETALVPSFPQIQGDNHFRDFFRFFVNFPRDDMLTTYKWAVITDQFGPFEEFVDNFRTFACRNGFLGLINCVEAEEHLTGPNTFLLRFSRKEPEKLTFSFKVVNSSQALVCRHKRKPCGVPIREFIAQHFNHRNFSAVNKHLQYSATQLERLEQYCGVSGYLIG